MSGSIVVTDPVVAPQAVSGKLRDVKPSEAILKSNYPVTRGVRFLRQQGVVFEAHVYPYLGPGQVAKDAATALSVPESEVFKTLVFQSGNHPLLAVVDAAHRVSLRNLSALVGADEPVVECSNRDAERFTGYQVGGISPFGTRRRLPVYLDAAALRLKKMFVNGGSRGFLVSLTPEDFVKAVGALVGEFRTIP